MTCGRRCSIWSVSSFSKYDLNWSKLIKRTRLTQERLRSCLTLQLNFQVDAMAGEYRSTMPAYVVPTIRFTAGDLSTLRGISLNPKENGIILTSGTLFKENMLLRLREAKINMWI
jgi:hypothetical protein